MDKLDMYARVVLASGINLRKGQCLLINCSGDNYFFARILGQEAYKLGAKYVHINVGDNHLLLSRIENQDDEDLEYMPHFRINMGLERLAEDWASISIDNTEENGVLGLANPKKLGIVFKTSRKKLNFLSKSMMKFEHPWCVVAIPGPKWAESVLGEGATEDQLWNILKPILKLDKEDPVAAWEEHCNSLLRRCGEYNDLKFDRLRFVSEGTDLTVWLSKRSRWIGGSATLPSGRSVNPNIPTEEIFTTPDWRRTEGYVKLTKPVQVLEKQVLGAEFVFKEGKVVSFTADEGEDALTEYFATDKGASYLGEVALVENDSPISKSGLIFNSILFDENASCHIALGKGYPSSLEGYKELDSTEKLVEAGCNNSLVHTDFMIGSETMTVTAYAHDGKEFLLMKDGNFVK